MIDNMALLESFTYRHEAEIIVGILDEDNIQSIVESDDCGGLDPALQYTSGVRLYVEKNSLEKAQVLLKNMEENGK